MDREGGRQVPTPSMNPKAQSHEALKAMTDAADPAGAQAVADGWAELASGFDEAAQLFHRSIAGSAAGWTGSAAEAMRAQLARIAAWSEETGARYRSASAAITEQSGAADSAKSNMPPPVPYNPAQMIKDARDSGNIFDLAALPFTMYAQKQLHDAAHDRAAEIVTNRDTAFGTAAASVPEFIPPPSLTAEPEGAPPAGPPPQAAPSPGPAGSSPSGDPGGTHASSASGPSAPSQGIHPMGFGPGSGGTAPAGFASGGFAPGGFGPGSGGFGGVAPGGARLPVARGPVAPMAGGPEKGQDGEQKRPKFLIEPEIEGMFGSDELTAPPVIGEG